MAATLFDHIKQITENQDAKYWDNLEESDKKSWSNYMILRFLSMNPDWTEFISDIQRHVQELPPKSLYLFLIGGVVPKGKVYLKYIKAKTDDKYDSWLIDLVSMYYQVSKSQSEDYLEILYATISGHKHILEICQAYGTEIADIKKLKLKCTL